MDNNVKNEVNEEVKEKVKEEVKEEYNALVLAGGGLKGFGILGGIQYIIDSKKIELKKIHYYAGTSIGAVICYFLAIGYNPIDIIIYCITNEVFDIQEIKSIDSILKGEGMYDFSVFADHFKKMTLAKLEYIPTLLQLYKQMNKTLFTCTYNITTKKKEYISYHNYPDMSCIDAITLSTSLPFIFNDCIYNENYFIDGGFVDNCPFSSILEYKNDINIICFNVTSSTKDDYKSFIDKFYTVIMIPINELHLQYLKNQTEKCIFIEILMEPIKIYDFHITHSKKLEFFSVGYNQTKTFFIS